MSQRRSCPKCIQEGKIKANLAVYPDGGEYCFRCGYSKKGDNRPNYKVIGYGDLAIGVPQILSGISNLFPPKALAYLYKYRVTDEEIARYKIRFIEQGEYIKPPTSFDFYNHLYFPIGTDGHFQTKAIDKGNRYKNLNSTYSGCYFIDNFSSAFIVTEGILDAIATARTGYSTIALLGSKLTLPKAAYIAALRKIAPGSTVFLWLDSDSAGEAHRTEIASFFEALTGQWIKHVRTAKDPKHYGPAEIEEILHG